MALREKYVLVFWLSEPRSADIVLKTDVLPDPKFLLLLPRQKRQVMWGREEHPARIIMTGTKKDLLKVRVSRDGEIIVEAGPGTLVVTTRKRALAELESRARKHLLDVEDELDQLVLVSAGRAPQPPRPAAPLGLHEQLLQVPALQDHTGDNDWVQLGGGAWILKARLHCIYKKMKKCPVKLYRALLLEFITEKLVNSGKLSLSGKQGTVKVPQVLADTALAYTSANVKGDFNVGRTATNFFGAARSKAATQRQMNPEQRQVQMNQVPVQQAHLVPVQQARQVPDAGLQPQEHGMTLHAAIYNAQEVLNAI